MPWTSPKTGFPPLWCFVRPFLQLTAFVVCLWVFALTFVFSKWKSCSIGLISGESIGHCRILHFFTFKDSWVAFDICFGSSSICTLKRSLINFAPFDWIWAESIYFRILPAASVLCASSLNTSKCHWKAMHARAITLLWIMSCSKPSPYFFPPIILVQVDLNFSCPKNAFFQKWSGFFRFFFFSEV